MTKVIKNRNKEDLACYLQQELGISYKISMEIVLSIFDSILYIVKSQNRVTLRGFGSFSVKYKSPRPGYNINTKSPVTVFSRYILQFAAANKSKKEVNYGSKHSNKYLNKNYSCHDS
ncbi:HU family DNA-binding protein [Rickettsia endosymbiont of Cardiosporidium cionae]|uniref:HU family DNA-binding protein n=1 Tax=Rickettsia endosymbiont of Cardiosporidium cionae TaxID=2777155 RepID=UPI00189564A5|nr:HU family DNA-binding protein [Rickettsia endosymbiont of Cardiosporidium cionae]KAF8818318.1 HU family DNA-binding protein [Rickettsia endosymbiont of Cardiosporidium cionae]